MSKSQDKRIAMQKAIHEPQPGHDHRIVVIDGMRVGFCGLKDDFIKLERCPKCSRENYVPNVVVGICTWCGWNANKGDADG